MNDYLPQEKESTTDAAKSEARDVGREGAAAGQHVAGVAKTEAKEVAHEAKAQAQNLVGQLGDDLRSQAGQQQQRVAGGLRSISDELHSMAANSSENGTATHLVQQAAQRAGDAAGWLDNRDPGSLLDEVRSFARQRPGVFLAVAAGAGLLAGRLTRGLASDDGAAQATRRTVPPQPAMPPSAGNPGPYTATPPSPETDPYAGRQSYTQPMTGVDPVAGPAAVGYEQVTDYPPTGVDPSLPASHNPDAGYDPATGQPPEGYEPLTGERPAGYNPDADVETDIDPATGLPRHRPTGL
jgi:hypothetical protein